MTDDAYEVGIVGCGSTGHAHARAYRGQDRTDVVAAAELGADGVLLASGVAKADDPADALRDLVDPL
jgi:predicted dehydrogenase